MHNLLIIEPGFQSTRELVLKNLPKNVSINWYAAWGLDFYGPEWIKPYVRGTFDFSYRKNNLPEKVREFEAANQIHFDGIASWLDMSVQTTNEAAHALGLPVISELRGNSFKNKYAVRKSLNEHRVDETFWFRKLESITDLENLLKTEPVPFPIIIKPTEMMASLAVIKVTSESELRAWFPKVLAADFEGENLRESFGTIERAVICEEFIEGDEYSVETLTLKGESQILGVTKKFTTSGTYWDELGHTFPAVDLTPNELESIQNFVERSHKALQFQNTLTHTEFRMQETAANKRVPRLMEINARLCGDYIYWVLEKATGLSTGALIAHAAMSNSMLPVNLSTPKSSWSVRFATEQRHCRIRTPLSANNQDSEGIEVLPFSAADDILYKQDEAFGNRLGAILGPTSSLYPELIHPAEVSVEYPLLAKQVGETMIGTFMARPADIEKMIATEAATWHPEQAASADTIRQRLITNPEAIIVCYDLKSKLLVGFFSAIKVAPTELSQPLVWRETAEKALISYAERNPQDNAHFNLVGVSLTVAPTAPKGVGLALIESAVLLSTKLDARCLEYVFTLEPIPPFLETT